MSKKSPSPTIVITDTDQLSAMADAILARAGKPGLTKNTVLNLMAAELAGAKTNWGGLKAMTGPLHATRLPLESGDITPDGDTPAYRLDDDGLVLKLLRSTDGETLIFALDLTEIPALEFALFRGRGRYSTPDLSFTKDADDRIVAKAALEGGATAELQLDAAPFQAFLKQHRETILDRLLEHDGAGESLHHGFIAVGDSQGADLFFDVAANYPDLEEDLQNETAEELACRIDQACRDAVWLFLAESADFDDQMRLIRNGPHHKLATLVIDKEWPLIAHAMRAALDSET